MQREIVIDKRIISEEAPTYIIAEMSANHLQNFDRAKRIIELLANNDVDAVKLQTYRPDTITIDCEQKDFQCRKGGLWEGQSLYNLYQKAYTPWEWQEELFDYAKSLGLTCFSTPFDETSVDLLEKIGVPAYKIASYEINDIPLIASVAKKGKPIFISTGIALLEDIERAINTCMDYGNDNVILLKCTSAYPSPYEEMNLLTIPLMKNTFECLVGLSDHTLGSEVAVAGVALGARVIEKHVTIKREDGGPDGAFSMEINEFIEMTRQIRNVEKALGKATFRLTDKQMDSRNGSRSLYVVRDVKKGEIFTGENVKSIRPGYGLHTKYYNQILGKKAKSDILKGTRMSWDIVE